MFQNNLSRYKNIFQYVYSNVYPEIYCSTEKRGFYLKSHFCIMFKTYKDKMHMRSVGKNLTTMKIFKKKQIFTSKNL